MNYSYWLEQTPTKAVMKGNYTCWSEQTPTKA